MDTDPDTLATALFVKTDDLIKGTPQLATAPSTTCAASRSWPRRRSCSPATLRPGHSHRRHSWMTPPPSRTTGRCRVKYQTNSVAVGWTATTEEISAPMVSVRRLAVRHCCRSAREEAAQPRSLDDHRTHACR